MTDLGLAVVVPDSIEPVEGWRAWVVNPASGKLVSGYDGTVWEPGVRMEAACARAPEYGWELVRHGPRTFEQAREYTDDHNRRQLQIHEISVRLGGRGSAGLSYLAYPPVEPPPGHGYRLVKCAHTAPDDDCSCGIYAVEERSRVQVAEVFGKVKLWGKVIPGERGYRAQYAYPAELYAPAHIAPLLADYGVDVVVVADPERELRRRVHFWTNALVVVAVANFVWGLLSIFRLLGLL